MLAGYLTGALICLAALAVGQAVMALCGRREPSVLAPAVGLGVLLVVADLAIQLPGRDVTAAVVLLALVVAGAWVTALGLRKNPDSAEDRPPHTRIAAPVVAAVLAALVVSIPFLANGRIGPLGAGLVNDDMASHLLFTEWAASHLGRVPDLVAGGYPLAPHSLVAAIGAGTGAGYIEIFGGLTLALAALAALTAYGALDMVRPLLRAPAAALAALPYLAAAWLAQGAFKEPMLALFIVAFALGLHDLTRRAGGDGSRPSRGAVESRGPSPAARPANATTIPLGLIAAGALYAYSFPGLAWLAGTAIVWGLLELLRRRDQRRPGGLGGAIRAAGPATGIALGIVVVAATPQINRMRDFATFGAFDPEGVGPKVGFGNLRQALDPLEGLSVWPAGDFRVSAAAASLPAPIFYLGGLLGAAALAWGLVAAWRRRESELPAALTAVVMLYLAAKVGGTPYTSAKALAIGAPVAMLIILRGLLSIEPAAAIPRLAPLRVPLAAVFVAGAVVSSFLPLRAGAVGPPGHSDQLAGFRGAVGKGPVLYLGRDQFAAPDLYPVRLGTPVLNHYNVKGLPNRFPSTDEFAKLDWDGLTPAQLDAYPYVITTRSAFQSTAPANFSQRAATRDYILWERAGPTPPRETLAEPDQPGAVLDCDAGEPAAGIATVLPAAPVIGPAAAWRPSARATGGQPVSQTLDLPAGHWEISLEYVSTQPLRLTAPGFDRTLPAQLGFRGPAPAFPTGGEVAQDVAGPVTFTASVEEPPLFGRLIGAESVAFPLRIVATAPGVVREIPASRACGRYVDSIAPPAPG